MAHKAQLHIDGREYSILECNYEFGKSINYMGIPCTKCTEGGLIDLVIVSPDDNDIFFHNWICNDDDSRDGYIDFTVVNKGNPIPPLKH